MCLTISGSLLLKMRNVTDTSCRENQNTHFVFSNFYSENCTVDEMWKIIVKPGSPRMPIGAYAFHAGYLRLQTHSWHVILIAFTQQQLLQERDWILHCMYCTLSVLSSLPFFHHLALTFRSAHSAEMYNHPARWWKGGGWWWSDLSGT